MIKSNLGRKTKIMPGVSQLVTKCQHKVQPAEKFSKMLDPTPFEHPVPGWDFALELEAVYKEGKLS
jgi:hypothetical protein